MPGSPQLSCQAFRTCKPTTTQPPPSSPNSVSSSIHKLHEASTALHARHQLFVTNIKRFCHRNVTFAAAKPSQPRKAAITALPRCRTKSPHNTTRARTQTLHKPSHRFPNVWITRICGGKIRRLMGFRSACKCSLHKVSDLRY